MAGVLINPDQDLQLLRTKVLSNYDINQKLAFPVRLLDHIWPQGVPHTGRAEFTVLDIHRTSWRFVCNIRRSSRGGYRQPEVAGAWKQFLKQKNIRVGDRLVFYLPPPDALVDAVAAPVFVISFKREIMLLGTPILAHIL